MWRFIVLIDSLDARYDTLRDTAHNFLVTQVGLSVYHRPTVASHGEWTCQTWNFYVFPRSYTGDRNSKRFMCQASSLEFLSEHNFDFNKFIGEGISYLPLCDVPGHEERIKAQSGSAIAKATETKVSREVYPVSISILICHFISIRESACL